MDNNDQSNQPVHAIVQQHPVAPVQDQPSQQPVAPPVSAPVSGPQKEAQPIQTVEAPVSEVLQPSEPMPVLSPEVKEAGVEVQKEHPELTLHDQKAGVQLAGDATPVSTQPSQVQFVMPKEEAQTLAKAHTSIWESLVWKIALILKQYKKSEVKKLGGYK